MGCDGCLTSAKGQNMRLEAIKTEAKRYAMDKKITVAIYKEGARYEFTTAERAAQSGIPILELISQYH